MEDDFDTGDARTPENEREHRDALRPLSLRDFSGQMKVVENLKVFVMATRICKGALDHTLLHGPPGLGETTLSNIIANELGVGFKVTSGPMLDKPGDPTRMLTSLEKGDVLFIDKIRRLSLIVEEYLYSATEDHRIDIVIDKGPSACSVQIDLAPFILIGATTCSGLLTSPLRARFGINMRLEYYDMETPTKIVLRSANILNVKCGLNATREVASRSRGAPCIANVLLHCVRDFTQVKGNGGINETIVCFSLEVLNIGRCGLDQIDNRLLTTTIDKLQGGPVGLATVAMVLGEGPGTLEEACEPLLIKEGFIKRTPRGREVTDLTHTHLGRSRVGGQGFLFDQTDRYDRRSEAAR